MANKKSTPLSAEAIAALRSAEFSGNSFRLTQENLPCYSEIKAVVKSLGGAWVAKKGTHDFPEGLDARKMVLATCDRGSIPPSNPLDYFPTPTAVVQEAVTGELFLDQMASLRRRRTSLRFLEPSGGSGAFVAAAAALMQEGDELVVVELNPLLADVLRNRFPQATVIEQDFLTYASDRPFDVVFMNPPFDRAAYLKHIQRARSMLSEDGVLTAIAPSNFTIHDDFVYDIARFGHWIDLGGGRFSGTKVATSIIWIRNDTSPDWREEPREGYANYHEWAFTVAFSSDGDALKQLSRCSSPESALPVFEAFAKQWTRDGQAVRADLSIVRNVLRALAEGSETSGLDHLLTRDEPPAPAPRQTHATTPSLAQAELQLA